MDPLNQSELEVHEHYMQEAIRLGALAPWGVNPHNLRVGCVIVKDNVIIGKGFYNKQTGIHHAEVQAVKEAEHSGYSCQGADVYITLEPCSHYGNTPPCCDLLIQKKISRLIIPFADPNPMVQTKGIQRMQAAGITIHVGILAKECWDLAEEFLYYHITSKPLVTAKWAASIDGKIAAFTNQSKWISGEEARIEAHALRAKHEAILVGNNTLRYDNPGLDIRYGVAGNNPIRLVLSLSGQVATSAKLWQPLKSALITTEEGAKTKEALELASRGIQVIAITPTPYKTVENKICKRELCFDAVLKELAERKISSILVEGGGETLGSALLGRNIQKIELFVAPIVLGGAKGVAMQEWDDFSTVSGAEKFTFIDSKPLGDVIWLRAASKSLLALKDSYTGALPQNT